MIRGDENLDASPAAIDERRQQFSARAAERRRKLCDELRDALTALGEPSRITVEFGCGHGHFLVAYASRHPAEACLGIDISRERLERAGRKQRRAKLPNVQFVCGEAGEAIELLPRHVMLQRLFVLFPDPWPKRRHRKHRFLSRRFLDRLSARSVSGARFHFRTDSEDYFSEVSRLVESGPDWRPGGQDLWEFEHPTVFQLRTGFSRSLVAIRR